MLLNPRIPGFAIALLFATALAWIVFRYLVTGRRIAHAPTLVLEVVFVALFMALFNAHGMQPWWAWAPATKAAAPP